MTNESKKAQEERAFDALIVGALLRPDACGEVSPGTLPELTAAEKDSLAKRREGLLERVFATGDVQAEAPLHDENDREQELAAAGVSGDQWTGFNRADTVDKESTLELERRRNEVRERKRNERKKDQGA